MSIAELKARDVMETEITIVRPDEKVAAVDLLMIRKSLGGVPILDKTDKLVGIVTQRDIMLSRFRTSIAGMIISSLMTTNPITVTPEVPLKTLLGLMMSHRIERLPVLDHGKLVGMIEPRSILSAVYKRITSN